MLRVVPRGEVELVRRAVAAKPEGHDLCGGSFAAEPMARIGG